MTTKKTTRKASSTTATKKKAGTKRQSTNPAKAKAPKRSDVDVVGESKPTMPERAKRISGLDLAAEVLAKSDKPLNAKAIAERVIAAGWKTNGRTPGATLYSAMTREIQKKGDASRFRKTDRGLFASSSVEGGK